MSENNVANFHNANQDILDIASDLQSLSYAFGQTGNKIVSGELYKLSNDLKEASKKMGDAFSGNLQESFKSAQENSGMLFKAILAGAVINPAANAAKSP